jgi:hypothetical protein
MERYRRLAASRAAGPPSLSPESSSETVLDVAVQYTFPASDPISIDVAYRAAQKRESANRKRGSRQAGPAQLSPIRDDPRACRLQASHRSGTNREKP